MFGVQSPLRYAWFVVYTQDDAHERCEFATHCGS